MAAKSPLKSPGESVVYDVCVIGAGWSGVLTTKYCLQQGLSVVCVEQRDNLGGIWNYQDEPGGVMKSTVAISCVSRMEAADFHMECPNTYFPHHKWVFKYIEEYTKAFHLYPHMRFNFPVKYVNKINNVWYVFDENDNVVMSRNLVVSTGNQKFPNMDLKGELVGFKGKIIHSSEYKESDMDYNMKNVVVIGGGDSGADIANELSYHTHRTYFVVPNGMWLAARSDEFFPFSGNPLPLDHLSSRIRRWILNNEEDPDVFEAFRVVSHVRHGIHGHDIPVFKSLIDQIGLVPATSSNDFIRRVAFSRVKPKPKISFCTEQEVQFHDGTSAHIDVIVLATGFTNHFPFLPGYDRPNFSVDQLYKLIFDLNDPTLAFVGYARPAGRGTWMSICESQARFVAHVFAGRAPLPSLEQRQQIIINEQMERDEYFRGANKLPNMEGLVNMYKYNDDLARLTGSLPNWGKLFRQSPKKWWIAVTAPYLQAQYLLNDPRYQEYALARMQRYRNTIKPRLVAFAICGRIVYYNFLFNQFAKKNVFTRLFKIFLYLYVIKRVLQWVAEKP